MKVNLILFSHFLQNVDIPPDNLLDHSQPLAGVDGIPGSLHLLAVHPVVASGVSAGAHGYPTNWLQNDADLAQNGAELASRIDPIQFHYKVSYNGVRLEPKTDTIRTRYGAKAACFGADLEPTGAVLAENSIDLQAALIIHTDLAQNGAEFVSAPEFVQFADLRYPVSSSSVVEPAGGLVSVSASSSLT